VTVKVEHILRDDRICEGVLEDRMPASWSAPLECLTDRILELLDKGHTAADAARAVEVLRDAGLEMRPSFLPFTPWSAIDDVAAVFDFVADHDLVGNVDPVQYAIRLLLPTGSLLLDLPEMRPHLDGYDADRLSWRWDPSDPAVDVLHKEIAAMAEDAADAGTPTEETFVAMRAAVLRAGGHPDPVAAARRGVPDRLTARPR
jgi:hypothetical protein